MIFNKLEFKKKVLPKDKDLNEERPYIDFIIDGYSLSEYLEADTFDVTPFGWGNNIDFELKNSKRLITFAKSKFENGLQSAYVCARCGDEGCGAIMFDILNHGSHVEWNNFVNSDGYPSKLDPDEKIDAPSLFFEIGAYHQAIGQLQKFIKDNAKDN